MVLMASAGHIEHACLPVLQVDGAMDVQPLPPAALPDRDRNILRRPAADRAHRMRRMHRVSKQDRLVGLQLVEQRFILLNESRLLLRVQLARDRLRFAVFHAESVQQSNQPRAAFVVDTAFPRDPGTDLAGGARQGRGDPGFQPFPLLGR